MSQSKILHVASGDLWGGAEAAVYELCTGLRERAVDVQAVILNPGELARRLAAAGIPTTVMNERGQSSLRILFALRRIAAAFRPDVIHSHRKKEHILACAVALTLSGSRPALVKTIHGAPEPRPGGLSLPARLSRSLELWCDREFDARVAVSVDLAQLLRREAGHAFEVVHNGIRPPEDALRPKAPLMPRVVGFAGRFVPIKRLDLLIQIAAHAQRLAPGALRFEIVGAGPLQTRLLEQAQSAGVTDTVTFVPFQDNIWNTLGSWDVAILTSDHEGLPMICLEALAAGVPVFAREVGGLRELVLDPEQGMLVDSADPTELARELVRFSTEPPQLGQRRCRLPPSFTAASMCGGYLHVYERVRVRGRRAVRIDR
jgi:glycosyltransferase involved in cell wall biosynthesis